MRKHRLIVVGFAFLVGVTVIVFVNRGTYHVRQAPAHPEKVDEFEAMLHALWFLPKDPITNRSDMEAFRKQEKEKQAAEEKLRQLGTNALPRLLEEVRAVGRIEATNRSAAFVPSMQLASAFAVLGSEARPLLPMLIEEFRAGRSIGPCVAAFQHIGGTDCGLILVSGLTNSDPLIRNGAVSVLSSFATNREVARSAVHPLLQLLKDDLEFSRALAASVLGSFRQEPETVVPRLLQVAKDDSDFVVRVSAIKAIGRFGTNATIVKADLEGIAATDRERSVRRIAEVAIRAGKGEIPPDEVQ
jgi:hypothetical protein